ncbi:MAG: protein kinase [Myxococcota bacterium]|nr:protein kinase [Myxococcota bacterium]
MGAVYRGELIQLGKPVAIKFLHDFFLADEHSRARFVREAEAMSKLSHPHCVSVVDYGIDGSPYIVMDYVTGRSLETIIGQEQISFTRAIRIALQILAGLAHAHGQGIIHRDIKPENIILNEAAGTGEQVRVIDFSLAKMAGNNGLTITGSILGTPSFMSPEQSRGEEVDARADLYSVGIVLFELLTGQNPFPGETVREILRMQREKTAPDLAEFAPGFAFSPEIEAVLKKALAKSRDHRFSSAFEFMEALLNVPEAQDVSDVLCGQIPIARIGDSAETMHLTPAETARKVLPGRLPATRKFIIVSSISAMLASLVTILIIVWISLAEETVTPNNELISTSQGRDPGSRLADPQHETTAERIRNAKNLLASGQTESAISALRAIRDLDPHAAEPPYLLGNLFSDKGWWPSALARYEDAIELNPAYARDPILIANSIRALAGDKAFPAARKLILKKIGQVAIPHLQKVVGEDSPVQVRRRATDLLQELTEGPGADGYGTKP